MTTVASRTRTCYYLNRRHASYILYANGDTDAMREALKTSKGPGNFCKLFMRAAAAKEHGCHPGGADHQFLLVGRDWINDLTTS